MIPFDELKIDALLVSGLPNIRYLTGFTGDNALLLLTPGAQTYSPILASPSRRPRNAPAR